MGEARIFSRGRFKISLKNCKNSLFQHMKFWVDFRKFSKNFLRKLWKMHYFSKYLTTHALISFRIEAKSTIYWKFWENFLKFSNIFLIKLQKIHYLSIFFKKLTNNALKFCAFGPNIQIVGKSWKFLMKFLLKIEFLFVYFYFCKICN